MFPIPNQITYCWHRYCEESEIQQCLVVEMGNYRVFKGFGTVKLIKQGSH